MLGQMLKPNQVMVLRVLATADTQDAPMSEIRLVVPNIEGYILGRSDIASTYKPDVDFSVFDGKTRGVSRRHAVLVKYNDVVHIIDLDSMNGTFINGTRLIPHEPHVLRVGDNLGIADLNMIIA